MNDFIETLNQKPRVEDDPEHLLGKLTEECGEVIQMMGKIQCYGLLDEYKGRTNKERLEEEVGQLQAVIDSLITSGYLDQHNVLRAANLKMEKVQEWYEYSLENK